MKYWGYLVAKLAVAAGLFWLGARLLREFLPRHPLVEGLPLLQPFGTDLNYTFAAMAFWLVVAGVVWAIIRDQRYRCRACLRRLRMPIQRGSWKNILFGRPQTEYICPYGHGTLQVDEVQITGRQEPDWQPHEDMWKELYSLEESKK